MRSDLLYVFPPRCQGRRLALQPIHEFYTAAGCCAAFVLVFDATLGGGTAQYEYKRCHAYAACALLWRRLSQQSWPKRLEHQPPFGCLSAAADGTLYGRSLLSKHRCLLHTGPNCHAILWETPPCPDMEHSTSHEHTRGHSYNGIHAHDNARIHNGDVVNYGDASADEKRVLSWLSPLSPSSHHLEALKQYQEGTLGWFFQNTAFQHWRDAQDVQAPGILWCRGHMGAGKTTLIAQILEHLRNRGIARGSLAIGYCRYSERKSQTLEAMLGLILAQLYERDKRGFDIPLSVKETFESQSCLYQSRPQTSQLSDWIQNRFSDGKPIYILLDAIDELDTLLVRNILRHLRANNVKLLVTSRDIPVIRQEFSSVRDIEICANAADIRSMVLARFENESNRDFQRHVLDKPARDPRFSSVREATVSSIVASAKHMYATNSQTIFIKADHDRFLLAFLHVDRILVCTNVDDVYYYLEEMPTQITALYDQSWKRAVDISDTRRAQRAKAILMWLSHDGGSLSIMALNEALCATKSNLSDTDQLSADEIVSACAGFVRAEEDFCSTRIFLSHRSAYQYLEDHRDLYFPRADEEIVSACMSRCSTKQLRSALLGLDRFYP